MEREEVGSDDVHTGSCRSSEDRGEEVTERTEGVGTRSSGEIVGRGWTRGLMGLSIRNYPLLTPGTKVSSSLIDTLGSEVS